jgi:hypothetical protein
MHGIFFEGENVVRFSITILLIAVSSVSVFSATYTVTDGYFSSMTIGNDDILLMTGGGGRSIWGNGNGILDIRSTTSPYEYGKSGIDAITMNGNSQLYFSGGSLRHLGATGNASIVLTGGQIGEINVYYPLPGDLNHITISCQPGWTYQNYYLSGLWLDDSSFNIRIYSQGSSGVFDNITIIPEPATLLLVALGGFILRKRKTAY